MAAAHPEVVDKVVIWGSNSYISETDMKLVSQVRDVSKWSERMRKPMEDVYGADYFPRLWSDWVDAYQRIYEENGGEVVANRLGSISADVLVVHGDKDAMVDPTHPDHMAQNIKGAKLHRFPDGKHNLHLKYAKEFNELVANFFSSK